MNISLNSINHLILVRDTYCLIFEVKTDLIVLLWYLDELQLHTIKEVNVLNNSVSARWSSFVKLRLTLIGYVKYNDLVKPNKADSKKEVLTDPYTVFDLKIFMMIMTYMKCIKTDHNCFLLHSLFNITLSHTAV